MVLGVVGTTVAVIAAVACRSRPAATAFVLGLGVGVVLAVPPLRLLLDAELTLRLGDPNLEDVLADLTSVSGVDLLSGLGLVQAASSRSARTHVGGTCVLTNDDVRRARRRSTAVRGFERPDKEDVPLDLPLTR